MQDITNAWGNWMNKKHNGGGIKFTASTKYSDQEFFLKNYYERQVQSQMLDIQYAADDTLQPEDKLTADTGSLRNDTNVTQTSTFAKSFSTTQSFTWSVTEQLSIGTEVSATVGIPDVASAGQSNHRPHAVLHPGRYAVGNAGVEGRYARSGTAL